MELSTPLKDKDKSPNNNILPPVDFTPKPSQLSVSVSATPLTEGRARRTAATKADKYIDIVSRRLAEVPANGSTPKSMKIAGKLISEATPNSRRNILLSSTMARVEPQPQKQPFEASSVPVATPFSARKRNRAAKIREMFQTPLLSLATAATSKGTEIGSLSPAEIDLAPSTISNNSKLSQVHTAVRAPSAKASPIKSPLRRSQRASPAKSPLKRSQRVSPARKPSPLKEQISQASVAAVAATPNASRPPLVEFVAPQSVLRSSKRPRKQIDTSIYSEDVNSAASPGVKKQAKFADPSIFPTVTVNSQIHVKITPPQTPQMTAPSISVIMPPNSTRVSNVSTNVPAIIIPLSAARAEEETSSSEDLTALASTSSKRTPLRVQSMRTPTRAKAVIPSLSDYSAATKIAVIEVAKNHVSHLNSANHLNNVNTVNNVTSTPVSSATPKVEPWTARFMQKDSSAATLTTAPPVKSSFNINIKPVDTSKISGFSNSNGSSAVPIVPKFPLNLGNISNITKSTTSSLLAETMTAKPAANPVAPPESPLTRAKRIDTENSSRDEKLKTMMTGTDKLKKAIGELSSEGITTVTAPAIAPVTVPATVQPKAGTTAATTVHIKATTTATASKLPIKPKSATAVLPSPKIPSRLAEAFSGIDSELPPLDMAGMVDDDKILKTVLGGGSASSSGLSNPKMKRQQQPAVNPAPTAVPSTPVTAATQLHRTAVLNSAARKINPPAKPNLQTALPTTPKPQISASVPSKTPVSLDSSSPQLPEIHSE